MDNSYVSVPELAQSLGVSLPRAHRLLDAKGVPESAGRGRPRRVDRATAARLGREIGAVPLGVAGLSRVDLLALAAVSRAGLGLESARAVARGAGISPTTAGASLRRLEKRRLIRRCRRRIVQGLPRMIELWQADLASSAWTPQLRHAVSRVDLPVPRSPHEVAALPSASARCVPHRFAHFFWNADLASLSPDKDGDFIASRLMTADDPDAWVWAISNLPRDSLAKAANLRGVTPRRRALIENLVSTPPS